jgi:hypothetical protein
MSRAETANKHARAIERSRRAACSGLKRRNAAARRDSWATAAELGLEPRRADADDVGINVTRSTALSTARTPVSATRVEPPTLEELRLKLATHVVDAQRAELQRHISRLADAGTESEERAA